jgi:hypothetical protein
MRRGMIRILFLMLLFNPVNIIANNKSEVLFNDEKPERKFFFGGMIGFQFGTIMAVDISPVAGYYFTPRLMGSLGLSYQYYRASFNKSSFSFSIYGARTGMSYIVLDNIGSKKSKKSNFGMFAHLEYEMLSLDRDVSNSFPGIEVKRFWLPGLLIGGGVMQKLGKTGFFSVSMLYNVLVNSKTPYQNPVLRVGFYF